jgi:hypothetical protein
MTTTLPTRLRRAAAAVAAAVALVATGLAGASPASALSPVSFTVYAPDKVWVGDWITLGIDCPTTCPDGILDATVSISGGPTLDLPAEPDYTTEWQVQGITSGNNDAPGIVTHTVTLSFTDETGSARTLTKTVQVNRDTPQFVESLTGNDGLDATVTWQPPLIDGGSPVTNYYVQVDEDPWVSLAATARSFSLAGLTYGPHQVRVIATNTVGWGWGDQITVLRGVLPTPPLVSVTGTAHPTVSWTESVGGGVAVSGYTIYSGGVPVATAPAGDRSVLLGSLDPGAQDIQVAADCAWGPGQFSAPVEWVQASSPSSVSTPSAVAGNGRLTVSWDAPSDDGGMPVTSYKVRVFDPMTSTVLGSATTSALATDVTGLLNGFAVVAQVAAVNAIGQSDWTDAAVAVAPNGPAPAASRLSASATDTTPSASQKVTVRGTLAISGKVETGQQVQVWIKPYGATSWSKAATAKASSRGAWSITRTFSSKTAVQARYLGSTTLNAKQVNSAVVTVSPAITVSGRTTTSSYSPRSVFTLSATVWVPVSTAGAPAGSVAKLQRKKGSAWITVATATLVSGKAKLHWKPTAKATYALRVYVAGTAAVRSGTTSTLTAKVV